MAVGSDLDVDDVRLREDFSEGLEERRPKRELRRLRLGRVDTDVDAAPEADVDPVAGAGIAVAVDIVPDGEIFGAPRTGGRLLELVGRS